MSTELGIEWKYEVRESMEVMTMKASEIIQEDGLVLIRPKKVEHVKGQPYNYDVRDYGQGKKKGWIYLDQFTKSAMRTVYNAMNEAQKAKYDRRPWPSVQHHRGAVPGGKEADLNLHDRTDGGN